MKFSFFPFFALIFQLHAAELTRQEQLAEEEKREHEMYARYALLYSLKEGEDLREINDRRLRKLLRIKSIRCNLRSLISAALTQKLL